MSVSTSLEGSRPKGASCAGVRVSAIRARRRQLGGFLMAKGSLCTALYALALTMTLVPAPPEATVATLRARSHHELPVSYHRRRVLPANLPVIVLQRPTYSGYFGINLTV